jgi:hypothetical protein
MSSSSVFEELSYATVGFWGRLVGGLNKVLNVDSGSGYGNRTRL